MVITLFSSKGGVGKTTSAVAIAAGMAQFEPTTLVDLDPQGQVGLHFGMALKPNVYHWLRGDKELANCIEPGRPEKLSLLLGDIHSKKAQRWFDDRIDRLTTIYAELPGEYVVFDTGGTGDLLQEAAIRVADVVVVPFLPEGAAVDGVHASVRMVAALNSLAQVVLLPVAYHARWNVHREALQAIQHDFPDHPEVAEEFAIKARVAVKQGVPLGQTVWELKEEGIEDARSGYSQLISRLMGNLD
jgi:chromosome partitioning protein